MVMTHYMELLSLHSPWFLILFMAVPVVFIETIFMAEAFSLLGSGKEREKWQTLSHEMHPLYWTPSKEGTFCVIRLNLS